MLLQPLEWLAVAVQAAEAGIGVSEGDELHSGYGTVGADSASAKTADAQTKTKKEKYKLRNNHRKSHILYLHAAQWLEQLKVCLKLRVQQQ